MGTGIVREGLRTFGGKIGEKIADGIDMVLGPADRSGTTLSRKTGQEDEYDPEKAKLEETRRINESLREYTRSLESQADALEKKCLAICKQYIDLLVNDIKAINKQEYKDKKMNINLTRLERQLKAIEKSVNGTIKNKLSKKISIDDAECLDILKMRKGPAKEKAMKQYADRVFRDALIELSDTVRDTVLTQCDYITEQIEDRLDDITASLEEMMKQFAQLEEIKQQDETHIEEKKCDIYFKLSISEVAITMLEETSNEKVSI